MRSGRGVDNFSRNKDSGASTGARQGVCGSNERMPFCRASLKVRPMDITSPTDFICVPRVVSAPGNFSNCHLGILTKIGRASCRERVQISVVDVALQKKKSKK